MRLVAGTMVVAMALPVCADAAVTLVARSGFAEAVATVTRTSADGQTPLASQDIYRNIDSFSGLADANVSAFGQGTGEIFDDSVGHTLVASASGASTLFSSVNSTGTGFSSYSGFGGWTSRLTSGSLAAFAPDAGDDDEESVVVAEAGPIYNENLDFIVSDEPVTAFLSVSLSGAIGSVANAVRLVDLETGNEIVGNLSVAFASGTATTTVVLPPSAAGYRVTFFGNVFDTLETDDTTVEAVASFTSTLRLSTVVPEPAAFALLAPAALLMRRRR